MYSRAVLKPYIFMKYYMLSKNLSFKSSKIQSKYMNVKVFNTHLKSKVDYQMLLYIILFTHIDGKISQISGLKRFQIQTHVYASQGRPCLL